MTRFFSFLRWVPFLGIVFIAIYFLRVEKTWDIDRVDFALLSASGGCLTFVFFFRALIWRLFLARFSIRVPFRAASVLIFKPALAKYIPGKVLFAFSSAAQMKQVGIPGSLGGFLFLAWQMLLLSSGLLAGLLGSFIFPLPYFQLELQILSAILSILVFSFFSKRRKIPLKLVGLYKRFFKAEIPITFLPSLGGLFLLVLIHWFLLGISFIFFFWSIEITSGLSPIFFQPLANNIGVLAYFAPAGVGVRESVMIGYLALTDTTPAKATVAVVFARVWFFAVEVILFVLGLYWEKTRRFHVTDDPPESFA